MAETDFDQAAIDIIDELGREATYLPVGGDPVPGIKVHLEENLEDQPDGFETVIKAIFLTIELLLSDLPREPRENDQITIGATTYTVKAPLSNDGRFVKVIVMS